MKERFSTLEIMSIALLVISISTLINAFFGAWRSIRIRQLEVYHLKNAVYYSKQKIEVGK